MNEKVKVEKRINQVKIWILLLFIIIMNDEINENEEQNQYKCVGFGKLKCRRYDATLHLEEMNKTYEQKLR